MKHLNIIFRACILAISLSLTGSTTAQNKPQTAIPAMDSVAISLITCGPGQEVYSLYGHTAIRFHDKARGQDIAINYGMFSFHQKFFILRFVFGLTDYEMGIAPFDYFLEAYKQEGRWVREQTLNLTNEEKWAISQAIDENYRPENRVYRYNYFYDNCTTRARDMIVSHLTGRVHYEDEGESHASFRSMIHQWNGYARWSRLGNDLLLGVKADLPTNRSERQFLPDTLSHNFDHATIVDRHGHKRPLVLSNEMLYSPAMVISTPAFPYSPAYCAWMLFAFVVGVILLESYTHKLYWGVDAILLTADGIAGLILMAMVFSQHPTVSLNFQILLLCPLTLVFAYPVTKQLRKRQFHSYLSTMAGLITLTMILGYWQHYDTAIYIVALSLLTRILALRMWCKYRIK